MTQRTTQSFELAPELTPLADAIPSPGVSTQESLSTQARPADPHELECRIQRSLQAHPRLRFSRLTVHQCPQGVCLEGSLETNDDGLDLCELVNEIAGVRALNHVVMRNINAVPR